MDKQIITGYVVSSVDKIFERCVLEMKSQDIDDTCYSQTAPIYTKPFIGARKIVVTVESVGWFEE